MKPPQDPAGLLKSHKFSLEKVQYIRNESEVTTSLPFAPGFSPKSIDRMSRPWGPKVAPVSLTWDAGKWRDELAKKAADLYPALFSAGQNAYPLLVSIRASPSWSKKTSIATFLLTAGISGFFLPLPFTEFYDFEVNPVLLIDGGMTQVPLAAVQFQRRDITWTTWYSPIALVPMPGKADRRESQVDFQTRSPNYVPKGWDLNLESCIDAIVLSLQSSEGDIKKALSGKSTGIGIIAP